METKALPFYKYQGTGNDFVLIDNRRLVFPKNDTNLIAQLCDRKFGIGADGLMLLENDDLSDFRMIYYNADGHEGSMCGNGGRCMVHFAHLLGIIGETTTFNAVDGLHTARWTTERIALQMQPVTEIREKPQNLFLNTGSPHHVQVVEGIDQYDVVREGKRLRYGLYGETGSNINFVEPQGKNIFAVRTYERGVEDETLSCGTGVTAVALAMDYMGKAEKGPVLLNTQGGQLQVSFEKKGSEYTNIILEGPVKQVFKGVIDI